MNLTVNRGRFHREVSNDAKRSGLVLGVPLPGMPPAATFRYTHEFLAKVLKGGRFNVALKS